ncbi:MAG: hypothetical protein HQ582_27645 [Planctomycetes bacterium]|nr:hypothetical protein [Planctomycetota bacterium]
MNRHRIIDPEGRGPVSAVEVTGPPTSDLARQVAAQAILGCSPEPCEVKLYRALVERLVVRRVGDPFLRWVVTELHTCFERADGWDFDGDEIQVGEYTSDGLIVGLHPVSRRIGKTSRYARKRVLVTARLI